MKALLGLGHDSLFLRGELQKLGEQRLSRQLTILRCVLEVLFLDWLLDDRQGAPQEMADRAASLVSERLPRKPESRQVLRTVARRNDRTHEIASLLKRPERVAHREDHLLQRFQLRDDLAPLVV